MGSSCSRSSQGEALKNSKTSSRSSDQDEDTILDQTVHNMTGLGRPKVDVTNALGPWIRFRTRVVKQSVRRLLEDAAFLGPRKCHSAASRKMKAVSRLAGSQGCIHLSPGGHHKRECFRQNRKMLITERLSGHSCFLDDIFMTHLWPIFYDSLKTHLWPTFNLWPIFYPFLKIH